MDQLELIRGFSPMSTNNQAAWTGLLTEGCKAPIETQAIITLAWRIACLLEAEMAEGITLEEAVFDCIDDADINGLIETVGHALDAVVHILSTHWVHGERFRAWHHRYYGTPAA